MPLPLTAINCLAAVHCVLPPEGRRLRGDRGGRSPPKTWGGGDGAAYIPPNISEIFHEYNNSYEWQRAILFRWHLKMLPLQCGNSKNFKTPPQTQTRLKLHVSYEWQLVLISTQIIKQFCSDDSLKCYHYSVEIQKILDRGGVTSPPQTPPQTQTRLKLHVSYEWQLVPISTQIIEQFCSDDSLKCYHYSVEIQKIFDRGGVTSPPQTPPQTQTRLKLHVSYEWQLVPISTQIIEQFCSDDSLKCYHYSVEIQKILDRGGVTSPPQTPPQTQTRLKLHVSYEWQLVPISTQIIEQFCSDDSLKCYHYSVEIQKILDRGGVTSPPQTPPQTQTRLKLHVSYEWQLVPISTQIIEQFCSDDSLKCYHYSVEIQKILDGEGSHPLPKPLPKLKHDSNYM